MFTELRVVKQQDSTIASMVFADFAELAKTKGFTRFVPNLKPNNGGTPNLSFYDDKGNSLLVNLGKSVGKGVTEGKISLKDLLGMQVIDGKNQDGEQRYYLGNNQKDAFSIDSVIGSARKLVKTTVSLADISKMIEI